MQAIETKYLPATNTKGNRIKATTASGKSHTIPYPGEYDTEKAHRIAANLLKEKMDWTGELIGGATKAGYAWVFKPK